jgi:hypothetical protein
MGTAPPIVAQLELRRSTARLRSCQRWRRECPPYRRIWHTGMHSDACCGGVQRARAEGRLEPWSVGWCQGMVQVPPGTQEWVRESVPRSQLLLSKPRKRSRARQRARQNLRYLSARITRWMSASLSQLCERGRRERAGGWRAGLLEPARPA